MMQILWFIDIVSVAKDSKPLLGPQNYGYVFWACFTMIVGKIRCQVKYGDITIAVIVDYSASP